jgi:endonuclease YncB( thermonuclease family)
MVLKACLMVRASNAVREICLMSVLAIGMIVFACAGESGDAQANEIKGHPSVRAGDILRFKGIEVQLYGLDAPERDQYCEDEYGRPYSCGLMSLDHLRDMVGRMTVNCIPQGVNDEGRVLAICYAGDLNLNGRIVRNGWAVARPEERPDYASMERLAKRERAGIWEFIFDDPRKWREENSAK